MPSPTPNPTLSATALSICLCALEAALGVLVSMLEMFDVVLDVLDVGLEVLLGVLLGVLLEVLIVEAAAVPVVAATPDELMLKECEMPPLSTASRASQKKKTFDQVRLAWYACTVQSRDCCPEPARR